MPARSGGGAGAGAALLHCHVRRDAPPGTAASGPPLGDARGRFPPANAAAAAGAAAEGTGRGDSAALGVCIAAEAVAGRRGQPAPPAAASTHGAQGLACRALPGGRRDPWIGLRAAAPPAGEARRIAAPAACRRKKCSPSPRGPRSHRGRPRGRRRPGAAEEGAAPGAAMPLAHLFRRGPCAGRAQRGPQRAMAPSGCKLAPRQRRGPPCSEGGAAAAGHPWCSGAGWGGRLMSPGCSDPPVHRGVCRDPISQGCADPFQSGPV